MSIPIGQLVLARNYKEKDCKLCKEPIPIGELKYFQIFRFHAKDGRRGFLSEVYHQQCMHEFMFKKEDSYKDKRKGRVPGFIQDVTRYNKNNPDYIKIAERLSPEKNRRRNSLLRYLGTVDVGRLIKAYTQGNITRVYKIHSDMYRHIKELDELGVEFTLPFFKNTPLREIMLKYDSEFYIALTSKLANKDSESRAKAIEMLLRTEEDLYQPYFPEEKIIEPTVSIEYIPESGERTINRTDNSSIFREY